MDAVRYSLDNSLEELREGCERHGLPTSGSKAKLLMRLDNFRMDPESKMQTEIARKERKPVSLGIPSTTPLLVRAKPTSATSRRTWRAARQL